MSDPIAVLVEDDPQQTIVSQGVLAAAGFEVRNFEFLSPALEYLRDTTDLIDLFVLDRRLPMLPGDPATDELGDELLREIRESFADSRVIVFTGFATIRHVQESLQGSGQLPSRGESAIDRVTVLEKDQSVEFRQQVNEFRELLQELDNIEIRPGDPTRTLSESDKRLLRRVAFEYHAASVSATPLTGGLTDASVWRCDLSRPQGAIATVVAKRVQTVAPPGGLSEMLPRVQTTSRIATLSGLVGGDFICVLQVAGIAPESLMAVLGSDPAQAVECAKSVWSALDGVPETSQLLSVAEICASLIDWDALREVVAAYGISIPAGSLTATVKVGVRHGDLHPANVLIDNGAAVLIDFDSSGFASAALDPVTVLLSTLVHPDSPLRGDVWPDVGEIEAFFGSHEFGSGHSHEAWFAASIGWIGDRSTSTREFWALVLAYAGRQLRYDDVLGDPAVRDRVVAIARKAATSLGAT